MMWQTMAAMDWILLIGRALELRCIKAFESH